MCEEAELLSLTELFGPIDRDEIREEVDIDPCDKTLDFVLDRITECVLLRLPFVETVRPLLMELLSRGEDRTGEVNTPADDNLVDREWLDLTDESLTAEGEDTDLKLEDRKPLRMELTEEAMDLLNVATPDLVLLWRLWNTLGDVNFLERMLLGFAKEDDTIDEWTECDFLYEDPTLLLKILETVEIFEA